MYVCMESVIWRWFRGCVTKRRIFGDETELCFSRSRYTLGTPHRRACRSEGVQDETEQQKRDAQTNCKYACDGNWYSRDVRTCDDLISNSPCARPRVCSGISFRQNFAMREACLQYEDADVGNGRRVVGDVVVAALRLGSGSLFDYVSVRGGGDDDGDDDYDGENAVRPWVLGKKHLSILQLRVRKWFLPVGRK